MTSTDDRDYRPARTHGFTGLWLIGVGVFLAVNAGRHESRWWRRAPWATSIPSGGAPS